MGLWNLGSCATEILTFVEGVPSSLSGAPLERLADRARLDMERYTGDTIGSVDVAEKYQPAWFDLSISELLCFMQLTGADAAEIKLGDFVVKKGAGGNLNTASKCFKDSGYKKLKNLGFSILYGKANV